jgi:glycosyltransferase involved in cell wall biosynthesis
MINGKKVVIVMPAYNAAMTLEKTYNSLPLSVIDEVVLTDDHSQDDTVAVAAKLGLVIVAHDENKGYGGNQKTCYDTALHLGADVIVMVHPDYQYEPRLVTSIAAMISSEVYDICLGSRILGNTALRGGMPIHKYLANRILTAFQNLCLGAKLSEYHTGFRAYSRQALSTLHYHDFSNDFVFDNQLLTEAILKGLKLGEISCPTRYAPESSSIGFRRSIIYGFGVTMESLRGLVYRLRWLVRR